MVQQSKPWLANSFMTEYSPLPGTERSNTREVTDEPCTKNTTGRATSPAFGAPSRLRYIHKGTSPFLAQYSRLKISPPSGGSSVAAEAGIAPVMPAAKPAPMPLMTVRRAGVGSDRLMVALSDGFSDSSSEMISFKDTTGGHCGRSCATSACGSRATRPELDAVAASRLLR